MSSHTALHHSKNPAGFPDREMSDCETILQNHYMTRGHVLLPSILNQRGKVRRLCWSGKCRVWWSIAKSLVVCVQGSVEEHIMHMVKHRQVGINSQASTTSAAASASTKKVLSRPALRSGGLQQLSA